MSLGGRAGGGLADFKIKVDGKIAVRSPQRHEKYQNIHSNVFGHLDNPLSVINSVSLVNNIQKVVPPEKAVPISFDVIALFPSIPKHTTIDHTRHLLLQSHVPPEEASDFNDLLNLSWSTNPFLLREKFYSLPETVGIPIGSPLGSLISEIFMHKFESDLFSSLFSHV